MGLFGRKAAAPAVDSAPAAVPFTPSPDGLPVFESHSGALWVNGVRLHMKGERGGKQQKGSRMHTLAGSERARDRKSVV